MNQQIFAAMFASVVSTYFGALILMYIMRVFLTGVLGESSNNQGLTPASFSKDEVGISTSVAIPADLLAD